MSKKLSLTFFTVLACLGTVQAEQLTNVPAKSGAYFKLETGPSFAQKAHVYADPAVWDPAVEGYDARLHTRPLFSVGFGYEFSPFLSTEVSYTTRPNYEYKKFQDANPELTTPGKIPEAKTRRFKLDANTLMFNLNLSGRDYDSVNYRSEYYTGSLYPVIGFGVGLNQAIVHDFRSTGLSPTEGNDPLPSYASESQSYQSVRFAYELTAGLEYRRNASWAVSTGYRWLDSGRVRGPQYIRDNTGLTSEVPSWKIKFAAHELFFALKYFL